MRNKILILALSAICTTSFSSEKLFIKENLDISIKEDPRIVAYMKDVVTLPEKDAVIADVISPNEMHHNLNFEKVSQKTFNENYWFPQETIFDDSKIDELLVNYKPKLKDIDNYHIFLANLLYASGSPYCLATKNPDFLEYAASIGHADAQYKMFSIALKSKKYSEAKNYLLSAAAQRNSEALLKLSDIYQGGYQLLIKDISKDLGMSERLCRESAVLGNEAAQFRLEVATLTEGFFGSKTNYQEGIKKAKELANKGNKRAEEFINSIMQSSSDSLMEGNELITQTDLEFLKSHLGWEDIEEMS